MAPTLAFSNLQTEVSTNTLVSASFTPAAGDVLVVKTGTSWNGNDPGTPTDSSGQTWTLRAQEAGGSFNGRVAVWTATVVGSPGSITVSITPAAFSHHPLMVERWTGALLAATPAVGNAFTDGSAAPSTTITTAAAGSVVSWCAYDMNSVDPAGRTYLSSATEESISDQHVGTNGVFYFAYQDAASSGSQTFGLSAPSTMRYNMAGIEIQAGAGGGGGGGGSALPARPIVASGFAVQRSVL